MNKVIELIKINNFLNSQQIKGKCTINEDFTIDVDGDVILRDEKMERLPVQFRNVTGWFYFLITPNITTLEGCPEYVGGWFHCSWFKKLKNLHYSPKYVGGNYVCCENNLITSLEGAPEYVGGVFICNDNENLMSLKGAPKHCGGFNCERNSKINSLCDLIDGFIYPTIVCSDFGNFSVDPIKGWEALVF